MSRPAASDDASDIELSSSAPPSYNDATYCSDHRQTEDELRGDALIDALYDVGEFPKWNAVNYIIVPPPLGRKWKNNYDEYLV